MSIYDEMQEVAREILGDPDFKQGSTQLLKLIPGDGPVDNPGRPVRVTYEIDGAVRGVKWKFVNMGLADASDLQITFSVLPDAVPEMADFIIADGVQYKITRIIAVPAVGVPVVYTCIIQR